MCFKHSVPFNRIISMVRNYYDVSERRMILKLSFMVFFFMVKNHVVVHTFNVTYCMTIKIFLWEIDV